MSETVQAAAFGLAGVGVGLDDDATGVLGADRDVHADIQHALKGIDPVRNRDYVAINARQREDGGERAVAWDEVLRGRRRVEASEEEEER